MLDLLENFYDARARPIYRKPETNAATEAFQRPTPRSTLIINDLLNLCRLTLYIFPPANGQKLMELPYFVYLHEHKSSPWRAASSGDL